MTTERGFSSFPYEPYSIQLSFMNALYKALEEGKIGLLESPTGTGKTLSIICATLEWLENNREKLEPLEDCQPEGDEPDWILEQLKELTTKQQKQSKKLDKKRPRRIRSDRKNLLLSDETNDCFEDSSGDSSDDEEAAPQHRQLIYCSRTHSQLSQFIGELKRTRFSDTLSVVALASRKSLCINEDVKKLSSVSLMNERCLDLKDQRASTKKKTRTGPDLSKKCSRSSRTGCRFLISNDKDDKVRNDSMIQTILSEPLDIEALGKLGKKEMICPYYASRSAVRKADVVLLPYSSLLSEDTKESLGISTEDNILIIDEAHNLMDAINNTHKAVISESILEAVLEMLQAYYGQFDTRLSESNSGNLQTLIRIAQCMLQFCQKTSPTSSESMTVNQFLFDTKLDDVNFLKLVKWMQESKLPFKISSYGKTRDSEESGGLSRIFTLVAFLKALHNEDRNGCIISDSISKTESQETQLTFILLNPAIHFEKILKSCHSVILTSGTLSPLSVIKTQLFADNSVHHRLTSFSCHHIVPQENVLALSLTQGPSSRPLDLRFDNRSKADTLTEIGVILYELCHAVPGGFVVFVPSFSYQETLIRHLKQTGVYHKIHQVKDLLVEPRNAIEAEEVYKKYRVLCSEHNCNKNGTLLLSIVGGKMSEGINFGDELGRCVLMLGLPYPSFHDPELQARLDYLVHRPDSGVDRHQHYNDLCMKAVNQCIGRVIRHSKDFACIVLADNRYSSRNIIEKLPKWIQDSYTGNLTFQSVVLKTKQFFESMK
eukprot:g2188.t1